MLASEFGNCFIIAYKYRGNILIFINFLGANFLQIGAYEGKLIHLYNIFIIYVARPILAEKTGVVY